MVSDKVLSAVDNDTIGGRTIPNNRLGGDNGMRIAKIQHPMYDNWYPKMGYPYLQKEIAKFYTSGG